MESLCAWAYFLSVSLLKEYGDMNSPFWLVPIKRLFRLIASKSTKRTRKREIGMFLCFARLFSSEIFAEKHLYPLFLTRMETNTLQRWSDAIWYVSINRETLFFRPETPPQKINVDYWKNLAKTWLTSIRGEYRQLKMTRQTTCVLIMLLDQDFARLLSRQNQ